MTPLLRERGLVINYEPWLMDELLPTDSISILGGIGGARNTQIALELALSVATGIGWHGKDVSPMQHVLYITVDSQKKVARRINTWKTRNNVLENPLLSILSEPIDLLDKNQLRQLVTDISYYNDENPVLVVFDLQQGLTSESTPTRLLNSINFLRGELNSAFLLVFNEGSNDGDNSFIKLFNAADAVHAVTAIDDDLAVRVSCIKMKDFVKPDFVELDVSCVKSSKLGRYL